MPITAEEISRLLALLEKSSFDEIRIDEGELHIALSRNGASLTASPAAARPETPPPPAAAPAAPTPVASQPSRPPSGAPAAAAEAGLVEIKAPIVGIFYTSPEPGAEPFVAAGQAIDAEMTVGIIEVMKVFNTVPAGLAGTIVRRLVENGEFVEFGQPLFLVRPAGV